MKLNKLMLTTTLDNYPIYVDMHNVLTFSSHQQSNKLFDVAISSHLIKQPLLPDHFYNQLDTSSNLSLSKQHLKTNAPRANALKESKIMQQVVIIYNQIIQKKQALLSIRLKINPINSIN